MAVVFSNNATTTLTSNISSGATSITVADGSVFPALSGSDYTYLTFEAPLTNDKEIVKLTARSGNTLTVVRAQDGTSASAFSAGDKCELRITAALLNDLNTEADTESVSRAGDSMTGNLSFGDNNKAIFGAGSDLEIYSDGTSGIIQQVASGVLLLKGQDFYVQNDAGSNYIRAQGSAQVDLYYGGVKKFETTSTGIDVTGTVVADGLESSGNLSFTAADGIDISGKESVIIRIDSDDNDAGRVFQVRSGPTSSEEILLQASEDAGVFLYYDNAVKLSTTNTGVDVTGVITTDGMTTSADINFGDSDKAVFGAGSDLQIYHDGQHGYINNTGTGSLFIQDLDGSGDIYLRPKSGQTAIGIYNDNTVEIAHAGNVKLATTSTGIDVTGTATVDALTSSGSITATGQTIFAGVGNFSSGLSVSGTYSTTIGTNVIAFSRDGTSYIDQSSTNGNGMIVFRLGSTYDQRLNIGNSAVVLNEESDDVDFRVESNSNTNMLFVDAGNNAVALGTTDIDNQNNSAGSAADNGFAYNLGSGGYLSVARYGGTVAYLNRTDSDGTILDIRKDGSTVGTLGSNTARFFIHNNYGTGSGFRFDNGFITPSSATGAAEDNTTDLGSSSARFKDLFLSGTANAGGLEVEAATPVLEIDSTASANLATLQFTTSGTVDSKITHQASSGDMVIESGRNSTWGGKIYLKTDTFQNAVFTRTTSTFNENSADIDFRVESNGATHMLFVDAGNDRVGVNESAPDSPLHVKRSAVSNSWSPYAGTTLTLEENSGNGNILQFMSDNAATGEVWFGDDDSRNAGRIRYEHDNNKLELWTNGTERLSINSSGAATFNSSVTTGGEVSIAPSTGTAKLRLTSQGIGSEVFTVNGQIPGVANGGFAIRNETDSRNDFFIDAVGATTLGYNLTIGGDFLAESSSTINSTIRATGNNTRAIGNYQAHDSSGNDVNMVMGVFGDANRGEISTNTNHTLRLYVNNTPSKYLEIATTGQIFTSHGLIVNEDSHDSDFRVESNGNSHMLFVDAGNNRVGVGGAPSAPLDVRGANTSIFGRGQLYISNTESAAINAGSQISLGGTYSGTADTFFASISGRKENGTAGNYAGYLSLATRAHAGNNTEWLRITSEGSVGINQSVPQARLHVDSGLTDATAYFDSSSTNGSHVRFLKNGTVDHYLGSTGGFGFGDSDDFGIRAKDKIRFSTGNSSNEGFIIDQNNKVEIVGTNQTAGATLVLREANNNTNDNLGTIYFGNNVDNYQAEILGYTNTNSTTSYVRITTTATGASVNNVDFGSTETIFNNAGADLDFRVESDNSSHALFVDGANGAIGFGTSLNSDLHSSATQLLIGSAGSIYSERASSLGVPAAAFGYNFYLDSDTGAYAARKTAAASKVDTRAGTINLEIAASVSAGAAQTYFSKIGVAESSVVVNDPGANVDFRVESDTNSTALFMDASLSYVGINRSPAVELDIKRVANATPVRIGSEGGEGRGIVFADVASSPTKYNFFVGAQQNHNNAFEITPSTVVGGYTFTNVALSIDENSSVVVNQTGVSSADFRVESDNNANMLFVNAGTDKVGIGVSDPQAELFVRKDTAGPARLGISNSGTVGSTTSARLAFYEGNTETSYIERRRDGSGDTAIVTPAADNPVNIEVNGGNELASFKGSAIIFNENGGDQDFRVESSGSQYAFFVDGGTNNIGIQTATNWSLAGGGSASSSSGVSIDMAYDGTIYAGSAYWAGGLKTGTGFFSDASGDRYKRASRQVTQIRQSSQGGDIKFRSQTSGTAGAVISWHEMADFGRSEVVFNDGGLDQDFRVESDSATHMFFVDASSNKAEFSGQVNIFNGANTGNVGGISITPSQTQTTFLNNSPGAYGDYGQTFKTMRATGGSAYIRNFDMTYGGSVFNEDSADIDFRVESDNNSNAVFVNAGTDSVHFGTSGNFGGSRMNVEHPTDCFGLNLGPNASGQRFLLYFNYNGTPIGSVKGESTGVTYNTTSDRRLKKDIETITDGTDKLMAMNPVTHRWKADPEADAVHGFIAQEMMDIVPEAVSGDPEGEEMMSMDYGRITPVLVAALQDAHQKIAELETRLNELEGK